MIHVVMVTATEPAPHRYAAAEESGLSAESRVRSSEASVLLFLLVLVQMTVLDGFSERIL